MVNLEKNYFPFVRSGTFLRLQEKAAFSPVSFLGSRNTMPTDSVKPKAFLEPLILTVLSVQGT